jgi:PPK2 family polyphosphate:nucleotide phosphotransferase
MSYLKEVIDACRVKPGERVRLKDRDPEWAGDPKLGKDERKILAETLLKESVKQLKDAQELLYASDTWSVLAIFQAPDAAGKDGTIEHVMSGVNPQGCQVYSFKQPSREELDHDYLWRCVKCLPERGRIGIFNRSYYEEVLIVRVHPTILRGQHVPHRLQTKRIWKERLEDIAAHERYLSRNGYVIRKFFLHVSRAEQKRRFLARIERPEKNWKFEMGDVRERQHWKEYMTAYEDAIQRTATPAAPWIIVPADNKWFTRLVISNAIVDALENLDLRFPSIDEARRAELAHARSSLMNE